MTPHDRDAWITGIGLVSNLGDGCEANWQGLMTGRPNIDEASFAPYPVHHLAAVDFTKQIPRSEQRLMDAWQRTGTYAAGLALESAGLKGCSRCCRTPTWSWWPEAASATPPSIVRC
jgi:3-oxoacyl-[acyl-carrier-protein] synthase II